MLIKGKGTFSNGRSGIHPLSANYQSPLGCTVCLKCGQINLPKDRREGNTIRRTTPNNCERCGYNLRQEGDNDAHQT